MIQELFLMCGLIGSIGFATIDFNMIDNNNTQLHLDNHKAAVYDDEEYTITFSSDELTNYHFVNFANLLASADYSSPNMFTYASLELEFSEIVDNVSVTWSDDSNTLFMYLSDNDDYGSFELTDGEGLTISFVNSGTFYFLDGYADYKQAIELDIQANTQNNNYGNVLTDIVSLLVGGITGLAAGLGSGVSALVGDIFLNAGHTGLSVFGYMVVIFAGVALAIALSRWIMNF